MPARMSSVLRIGLQHRAGRGQHVGAQRLAGLPGRFAADAGGARGPGAAAIGRIVGVAGDDAHALDRHAEGGRHALRQHRFGALALFGHAGMHEHGAGGVEPKRGAVLRGNARAADAIERRRRIGHFDEGREADAAIDAARAQLRLLGAELFVIHHRQNLVERGVVRELLELDAGGASSGIGIVGNQIAPPQLGRGPCRSWRPRDRPGPR